MGHYELKQAPPAALHEIDSSSQENLDDINLARIGKRAVLRVKIAYPHNERVGIYLTGMVWLSGILG